jgi:hypothetical protein
MRPDRSRWLATSGSVEVSFGFVGLPPNCGKGYGHMNEELSTASEIRALILAVRDRDPSPVDHNLSTKLNSAIAKLRQWPPAARFCDAAQEAAENVEWGRRVINFETIDARLKELRTSGGPDVPHSN